MVDYSELKKLAESLNRAIEQAEHKPGQWAGTAQSVGGICCAGEPFQIGKPWAKEEPWAHFSYKRDSWLAVAAVNALPQLMALIAENERVKARLCVCRDCGGQGEAYSGHSSYQGYNQPPEPDMDVCGTCGGDGVLGPLEDFESLAAERDQLKAENAGLKTGYEAYERVNAELKAEMEVLRKTLESCAEELAAEVICKHGGQKLEDMHPVTRRLYDRDMAPVIEARAAMGKGGRS